MTIPAIPAPVWLVWLAFIFVIAALAAWHVYEDKKYSAAAHSATERSLLWLARYRSVQFLAFALFFLIAWIAKDLRDLARIPSLPPALPSSSQAPQTIEEVEARMDEIKEGYEQAFVNYFFLRKCGMGTPDDYYVIQSALKSELAALAAPAGWEERIIQAALGSYEGVYIDVDCDPKTIGALQSSFSPYLENLHKSYKNIK